MTKPSRGRQRLEMVKMDNMSSLQVTFSKRRAGLFKKASELATLCGAEIALVVFSPGQKPFSFGNPSFNEVVGRFLNNRNPPRFSGPTELYLEAQRKENTRHLNIELGQLLPELEAVRKHVQDVRKLTRDNPSQNWWEKPVGELTLPQLERMKLAMEELRKDVVLQGREIVMDAANTIPPHQPQIFYEAGGSNAGPVLLFDDKNTVITSTNININPPLPLPLPPQPPTMKPSGYYNLGGGGRIGF